MSKTLDVMTQNNWAYGGSAGFARYEFSDDFVDEDGREFEAGPKSYLEVATTISGSIVTVPAYSNFPVTESAILNNGVTVTCHLLDSNRVKRTTLFEDCRIYTSLPSVISLSQLVLANGASRLLRDTDVWTKEQVIDYVETRPPAQKMTALAYGVGRLFRPAVSPADPILIGDNDERIPANVVHSSKAASLNAAKTVLDALGGGTLVVDSPTPVASNVTIPATIALRFEGQGQLTGSSKTVTIVGPISGPPQHLFASGVTISLFGNASIRSVYAEWWGASPSALAATNATAINAANTALVSITGGLGSAGTILLGGSGTYDFNATLTLGSDAAAFTGICLAGTNGQVGTKLRWTGSTSETAVYLTRGRMNYLRDFQLTSNVAKGTSIGLRVSGPSIGTNTSGVMMGRIDINGFSTGMLTGDGSSGGHDASEFTFVDCTFEANNTGLRADGSNTLNLHFYGSNFDNNSVFGLEIASGGAVQIFGGAWGRNAVGIKMVSGVVSLLVSGVRDEGIAGSIFLLSASSNITAQITVIGSEFAQVDSTPVIQGIGNFTLIGNGFGSFASIVYPFLGNSGSGQGTSLTMIGNTVNEAAEIFSIDGNSAGMTYTLLNNIKLDALGANGHWDNEQGVVDPVGPSKRAYFKASQNGILTADILTFTALDATPTVKFSSRFKTNNAFATSITTFDDGVSGQIIHVIANDANTTFVNGATLATRTGANVVATSGLTYSFLLDSTVWRQL